MCQLCLIYEFECVFKPWLQSLSAFYSIRSEETGSLSAVYQWLIFFYVCSWRNSDQPERLVIFLRILRIWLLQFWSVFLTTYFHKAHSWMIKWLIQIFFIIIIISSYSFLFFFLKKKVNCSLIVCRALWFSWCVKHRQNRKIQS